MPGFRDIMLTNKRFRYLLAISVITATALSSRTSFAQVQTSQPALPPPRAQPIEPLHDFGKIGSDGKLSHSFKVTNSGGQPLLIKQVAPDCSCTTTIAHPQRIEPGATALFSFEMDPAKMSGSFVRHINVMTNDPVIPTMTFTLTGDRRRLIDIIPASAGFGRVVGNEVYERVVTLTNRSDQPLQARIEGPARSGKFEFELIETVPNVEYKLFVVLRPPYEEGNLAGNVMIRTNIQAQSAINISAAAVAPPILEVLPGTISVGEGASASTSNSVTRVCEVFNLVGRPIRVLSASCEDPGIKVVLREIEFGRLYRILATIPRDFKPPPEGRSIALKTDSPEKPEVRIPIQLANSPSRAGTGASTQPADRPKNPVLQLVGKPAPKLSLVTMAGRNLNDSEFRFFPATVLNFVAPNCPFCKRQLPSIEKVRAAYEDRGVRFVNVSETLHEKVFTPSEAQVAFDATGAYLELAMDPGNRIGTDYKITSFPVMVIVSKDGRVADALIGAKEETVDKLRGVLDSILAAESGVLPNR